MKNHERNRKLLSFVKSNKDGFSLYYDNLKEVKKGFVVSFTHLKSQKNLNLFLDKLSLIKTAFPQMKKSLVVGGWYDEVSQSYFLDLGLCVENKRTALTIARNFNQLAIFNLNNFQEIRV